MCSAITPDYGYDNSTFILIGDVYCPITKCLGNSWLHKRLFNLSAEAIILSPCPQSASVCQVRNLFLKIKQILFSCRLVKGFYFSRDSKINSRCYWRCVLSWQVLFKQIEMGIIWRLCNNSEIHIWLWKEWSLVVCSQNSFYVTRERKDDKNRQNAFFLC